MKVLLILVSIIVAAWFFDRVCLWLEQKGLLYYRNRKPQKGVIGSALQELNAQLQPSSRHVIVVQQETIQSKKSETELP